MKSLLSISILTVIILSGCASTQTNYLNSNKVSVDQNSTTTVTASADAISTPEPTPSKPDLELIESHPKSEQYSSYVEGTIKNNTSNTYSYVSVEINLYDKDGNQVGSTLDNTTNLEAGGTWKFKAVIIDDNASKYKIVNISGN